MRSAVSDRHRPPLRQSLGRPASAQVTERDGQFECKVRAASPPLYGIRGLPTVGVSVRHSESNLRRNSG